MVSATNRNIRGQSRTWRDGKGFNLKSVLKMGYQILLEGTSSATALCLPRDGAIPGRAHRPHIWVDRMLATTDVCGRTNVLYQHAARMSFLSVIVPLTLDSVPPHFWTVKSQHTCHVQRTGSERRQNQRRVCFTLGSNEREAPLTPTTTKP